MWASCLLSCLKVFKVLLGRWELHIVHRWQTTDIFPICTIWIMPILKLCLSISVIPEKLLLFTLWCDPGTELGVRDKAPPDKERVTGPRGLRLGHVFLRAPVHPAMEGELPEASRCYSGGLKGDSVFGESGLGVFQTRNTTCKAQRQEPGAIKERKEVAVWAQLRAQGEWNKRDRAGTEARASHMKGF